MDARRNWAAFAIAIAAAAALASWSGSGHAIPPRTASGAPTSDKQATVETALGMSSCMAASCHGGPVQEEGDAWKSSYTSWFTRDPHAKAYNDLFNARSRRMIARLEQREPAASEERVGSGRGHVYMAALDRHGCLACHAHQSTADNALAASSLGCQDCHGPDHGWVSEHYLAAWQLRSAADRHAAGMADTQSLAGRASVCVGCHIGAPAGKDSPLRDMNHDLIAAGHPRLNFEFAAYLANLPPHWDEAKDRDRLAKIHNNVEAETWLTGQEVSGAAAIQLLIDRAERAANGEVGPKIWPEFSEYDCYGCHHQLASPTTRISGQRKPGQWQWGTWHFALVRDATPTLSGLITGMQQSAGPETIPPLARAVRMELRREQTDDALAEIVDRLSSADMDHWHWDQITQWYLGLRALQEACREQNRHSNRDVSPQQNELDAMLGQLEGKLKFTQHADSPWNFDAGDPELKQLLDAIRRILPALTPRADN